MPPMLMHHDKDPRDEIYEKVGMKNGTIPGFALHGNRVLLGIYKRPEMTKSGIHLSDKTRQEDIWQSKAGLVLMLGHSAFQGDVNIDFGPDKVEVGDWVLLSVTDGWSCSINGQECRIIRDQNIAMKIPMPDQVW